MISAEKVPEADALDHSINKWSGLQKGVLKKYGLYVASSRVLDRAGTVVLTVNDESCALCVHNLPKDYLVLGCPGCPLFESLGRRCYGRDSAYTKFLASNARPMLKALIRAKKERPCAVLSGALSRVVERSVSTLNFPRGHEP